MFILSRQSFLCRDRSFFGSLTICLAKFVFLIILCHDNLMCGSLNSYVATSTILSLRSFCATSSNWCRNLVFMSRQHFCFGSYCNNVSCIVRISIVTQKVCRDRVLSPLNLISCCSFILMLRHGLFVVLMFAVATQFIMSQPNFSSMCWNLYRNIEKSVTTLFICVQLISMS